MTEKWNEATADTRSDNGPAEVISETISEVWESGRHAKDRAVEASTSIRNKIDARREPAARTLQTTAQTLRHQANSFTTATTRAAGAAADKLDATADYIRRNELRAMIEDMEDVVRKHPGPALACAAVAGFLFARVLTRWPD